MNRCFIIEFEDDLISIPSVLVFNSIESARAYLNNHFHDVEFSTYKDFVICYYNGIEYYADVKEGQMEVK